MTLLEKLDLAADAAVEAERLRAARVWRIGPHENDVRVDHADAGPMAWRTRRRRIRRSLAGRLLLVFRASVHDAAGRRLGTRVVAALMPRGPASGSRPRGRLRAELIAAEAAARPAVEQSCAAWFAAARAEVGTFTAARASRLRAIAAYARADAPLGFQPGLFDRRAERTRDALAGDLISREARLDEHLRAVAAGGAAALKIELALAMTPR